MNSLRMSLLFALTLCSNQSHADSMELATLQLKCVETNSAKPQTIYIASNKNGGAVMVKDRLFLSAQMIAGTEGGGPYLQTLAGGPNATGFSGGKFDNTFRGYNITISGGDFDKAFFAKSSIENAKTSASVQLEERTFQATCTGYCSFE